jgi:hypothetical protein
MPLFDQRKYLVPLIITLILTIYQISRVVAFVNVHGGLEHDSAWSLGAARSLAERGSYTSMISTIVDPSISGGINVDGKFDIQDEAGRIWFRTSTSIGPASIVLDALVLKIFGFDFWALRAGPLLFYTLFLLLAAYILYQLAGIGAIVLFHAFLFCYPHLSIFLSYEALGEMPGMFYLMGTFVAFAAATQVQRHRQFYFLATGLIAGLAANAKALSLLSVSGVFIWAAFLWLFGRNRVRIKELLWLGGGIVLIQVGWELVQLIVLTRLTNFAMYLQHAQQRWAGFLDEGSGLRLRTHSGPEFVWRKFLLLEEVAHPDIWVTMLIFAGILLGGLIILWLDRRGWPQNLLAPIWLGWLVNTTWFVSTAKTGWMRHFWFGLVLAVLLLCVVPIILIRLGRVKAAQPNSEAEQQRFNLPRRYILVTMGVVLLGLIGWGFIRQPYVWGVYLPDEIVPYWQERQATYFLPGAGLPWYLIPRSDQTQIIDYINKLPPAAKVYYPANQKGAEIALQTARIFYPLDRRGQPGSPPHPADILLIPASVLTSWRDPGIRQGLLQMVEQGCPQPLVGNDNYKICLADQVIVPKEFSGDP